MTGGQGRKKTVEAEGPLGTMALRLATRSQLYVPGWVSALESIWDNEMARVSLYPAGNDMEARRVLGLTARRTEVRAEEALPLIGASQIIRGAGLPHQ